MDMSYWDIPQAIADLILDDRWLDHETVECYIGTRGRINVSDYDDNQVTFELQMKHSIIITCSHAAFKDMLVLIDWN